MGLLTDTAKSSECCGISSYLSPFHSNYEDNTRVTRPNNNWYLACKHSHDPLTPVSDQNRNFSLLQLYDVMRTSNENKEKYQLWDY